MDHLEEVFSNLESRLNGKAGGPLHTLNKNSLSTLMGLHFPDRKHEDWKYTSVQKLIAPKYTLARPTDKYEVADIPDLETYIIPMLNGRVVFEGIDPRLSAAGVTIRTLHEAMDDTLWRNIFDRAVKPEAPDANQAFEILNFAFQSGGIFLDIPKDLKLDKPIEIQFVHDDPSISFSHPLYFIHAGAGSECTLIERFEENITPPPTGEIGLINSLGYIHLDKNAFVRHFKWQNLPGVQSLVYRLTIHQQRDSRFESLAIDFGGDIIRNNVEVELNESNTYTSLQAGFSASNRQSMDHQTRINHKMPHCESHELYKGIIDDQASAAFNGKVYVHPDAQKTNAYQQNDTLVLSSNALMNSKPQLEIYADDVKCSHGATIGQLDDKALFYLRARGLDTATAKHILKAAFLAAVLDNAQVPALREHIRKTMQLDL